MTISSVSSWLAGVVLSFPQNMLADLLSERIEEAQLDEFDRKLRDFVSERTQEYDYDQIDQFLSINGLYATPKADSLTEEELNEITEKFFIKNPDLITNKSSIVPIIKNVVQFAHGEMYKHLKLGEKILYEQNKAYYEGQSKGIDEVKELLKAIDPDSSRIIENSVVFRLYSTAMDSLKAGHISTVNRVASKTLCKRKMPDNFN